MKSSCPVREKMQRCAKKKLSKIPSKNVDMLRDEQGKVNVILNLPGINKIHAMKHSEVIDNLRRIPISDFFGFQEDHIMLKSLTKSRA